MIGWHIFSVVHPSGHREQHTAPVDDLGIHILMATCPCRPVEEQSAPDAWVHNAFDGRESYEQGRKLH